MKKIIKESGIRDIKRLAKRYPKAKIYFHQDLDGVTTAIAMKEYLESNGIEVVDSEIIQYGDREFAVKKVDAEGDIMPVLVDFAHGKPMFKIHTDHHDRQVGDEDTKSKSFRGARSNVETISQIISPKELFTDVDIRLISTVDSADYAKYGITPDDVINYLFRIDKDKTLQQNKFALGLVINKLLLAFKNKPNFLENLVMNSTPSLMSILNNIKSMMDMGNYPKEKQLQGFAQDYIERQKDTPNVLYQDGIIVQYGGGTMFPAGSYDRYVPFKNNPEADFLVIAWPLGLLQASCNPFKKDRELKGVNLGEIAQEVLAKYESQLKNRMIPLSTIKYVSESSIGPESVGFTFKDFVALYGKDFKGIEDGREVLEGIGVLMGKPFNQLTEEDFQILDGITITAWDIIQANSGGHKCITNISGLNYLGRPTRPPQGRYKYDPERENAPYIKFVKMLQKDFVKLLQDKINSSKTES
jgi:hypothetical protein